MKRGFTYLQGHELAHGSLQIPAAAVEILESSI
jgi:hypothetical protein